MIRKIFLTLAATLVTVTGLLAQQMQQLPVDPEVRKGVLDNGMTYYIRHNAKPENQAEFWILHDVGAMQEEDSQQGLAHFLEHMAFNGTKNFPGSNLSSWLETIGVKFGVNLNAGTGQELTFYHMSSVPLNRENIIDSALLILHDWSYYITLDGNEIDNERGVIVEEMRTRNSAQWRTDEKLRTYLFGPENKYTLRNIIGHEDGLRTFSHDELRNFYHRWYRTDNQAVIVIGDFDPEMMENKVKALFSGIPAVEKPEPKQIVKVENNEAPIIGIITDPELTRTSATVYIKREPIPTEFNNTDQAAVVSIVEVFMDKIMKERLSDIARKPNAPFTSAGFDNGMQVSTLDATVANASARDGEALTAFEAIYTELERLARFGITQSEFERAKAELKRQVQQEYDQRNDRRSNDMPWTYISNFIFNKPMMGAEDSYNFENAIIDQLSPELISAVAKQYITPTNQVIIVMAPEKEGVNVPTEAEVAAVIEKVRGSQIEAMAEETVSEPLISPKAKLKGSKVVKTETDKFGATIWTLKNGAKVIVKPTDLKVDEVLMSVVSKGGNSILADDEILTAGVISQYINQAGISKFNAGDLRKQLAGKRATVMPFVDSYSNGISAQASAKDIETMLQLVYLSFTDPRFDEGDFNVMMDRLDAAYKNYDSNPMFILQKNLTNTLYNNSPRREVLSYDKLSQIDFQKMQNIYAKLYQNPDDFTYTIVGDVDLNTLRPLVEKYIGSLPKTKQTYNWVDDGVRISKGKITNRFGAKMEMPKTSVVYVLSGEIPYTLENVIGMDILTQLLDIRYTATIREEKGGTYGVSANGNLAFAPIQTYTFLATFDTDPTRADELKGDIISEIEKVAKDGANLEDLNKIKEYMAKQHPDDMKQNAYWQSMIETFHVYGFDLDEGYNDIINGFTPEYFKTLASKILADGNVVEVLMDPAQ